MCITLAGLPTCLAEPPTPPPTHAPAGLLGGAPSASFPSLTYFDLSHNWLGGLPHPALHHLCHLQQLTRLELQNVTDINSTLTLTADITALK